MADNNKVLFGFSDLYLGTYTVGNGGTVTLGAPYRQVGAVSFSPSSNNDKTTFAADNNSEYFVDYGNGSLEGDLVVAKFDDTFLTTFMGYTTLDDGGIAQVKNPVKPNVYMMFSVEGDAEQIRYIYYNGSLGEITREYQTIDGARQPVTASLPVSFVGDNETGIKKVQYKPGDTGYATLFTNPPVPTLPSA